MKLSVIKEESGKTSSGRVMSFIALFTAIWFGYLTINISGGSEQGLYLTVLFMVGAFAPASLVKIIKENKANGEST